MIQQRLTAFNHKKCLKAFYFFNRKKKASLTRLNSHMFYKRFECC